MRLSPEAGAARLEVEGIALSAGPVTREEAAALAREVLPRLFVEAASQVEAVRLPSLSCGGAAPRPARIRSIRAALAGGRPVLRIEGAIP